MVIKSSLTPFFRKRLLSSWAFLASTSLLYQRLLNSLLTEERFLRS